MKRAITVYFKSQKQKSCAGAGEILREGYSAIVSLNEAKLGIFEAKIKRRRIKLKFVLDI